MSQPTSDHPAPTATSVPLPRGREGDHYPLSEEPAPRDRRPGLTPATLFVTLLVAYVLIKIQLVVVLTLLSLVFATAIERPVQLLERQRVPRPLAILTVYIGIIATLVLFVILIAPSIGDQADTFREQAPVQLSELRQDWRRSANPLLNGVGQDVLGRAIEVIERPSDAEVSVPQDAAIGVVTGIGGGLIGLLTVFIITFYYMMEKSLLRRLVLGEINPSSRERVTRIWDNVEAKVGDWLRGQLTLCLIIGVTATIGYGILDVRFWPLLGLWAGMTEIIPIVGPWIGGVPAVIIALTMSPQKALMVAGFIVFLQFMENSILVPRVMRGAVGLTPLTVFVAILAGTQFLGLAGALLAIPIAAAVQVLISDYLDNRRATRATTPPLTGWRWMRGSPVAPVPTVDPTELPWSPDEAGSPSRAEVPVTPRWHSERLGRWVGSRTAERSSGDDRAASPSDKGTP